MTRKQLISLCLHFEHVYEDYPFNNRQSGLLWTTIRHTENKKIFALIFERDNTLCINLKCDPQYIDELRESNKNVLPGFHMNKRHWNTVVVNGDVTAKELTGMIRHSYDLTLKAKQG